MFSDPLPSNANGADGIETLLEIPFPLLRANISALTYKCVYMSHYACYELLHGASDFAYVQGQWRALVNTLISHHGVKLSIFIAVHVLLSNLRIQRFNVSITLSIRPWNHFHGNTFFNISSVLSSTWTVVSDYFSRKCYLCWYWNCLLPYRSVIGLTNEYIHFWETVGHSISFTALFSNLHANYCYYFSVYRLRRYVFISEFPAD
jgi:hypothetical protein